MDNLLHFDQVFKEKVFYLPDAARDALEQEFKQRRGYILQDGEFVPKPLSRGEWRERAKIIERLIPPEILDAIEDAASGRSRCPILIRNMTEVDHIHPSLPPYPEPNTAKLYSTHIAMALLYDIAVERQHSVPARKFGKQCHATSAIRKKYDANGFSQAFVGDGIHSDGALLATFTCPQNPEEAALRFIDIKRVISQLEVGEIGHIMVTDPMKPTATHSLVAHLNLYRNNPKYLLSVNVVRKLSDPDALKAYDKLVAANTIDINVQPHDMVVWPDLEIAHTATRGVKPVQDLYGRVASNVRVYR